MARKMSWIWTSELCGWHLEAVVEPNRPGRRNQCPWLETSFSRQLLKLFAIFTMESLFKSLLSCQQYNNWRRVHFFKHENIERQSFTNRYNSNGNYSLLRHTLYRFLILRSNYWDGWWCASGCRRRSPTLRTSANRHMRHSRKRERHCRSCSASLHFISFCIDGVELAGYSAWPYVAVAMTDLCSIFFVAKISKCTSALI